MEVLFKEVTLNREPEAVVELNAAELTITLWVWFYAPLGAGGGGGWRDRVKEGIRREWG